MELQNNHSRHNELKKRIMRRVYLLWSIRLALHPTTLKLLIAALLVFRSMKYVSYTNVIANMPSLENISAQMQTQEARGMLPAAKGLNAILFWGHAKLTKTSS